MSSLSKMLPYFTACGHNNYAKSVWLYLQQMSNLERDNIDVFHEFVHGFNVVRRTEVWDGLSPDLAIEQTLMRNLKSTGGLTRGTAFKVVQRNAYLFSRPACAEISAAVKELTGKLYSTSKQHKVSFFDEHNPFTGPNELRNIVSGVNASSDVDIDTVVSVGTKILEQIDSKTVAWFVKSAAVKLQKLIYKEILIRDTRVKTFGRLQLNLIDTIIQSR